MMIRNLKMLAPVLAGVCLMASWLAAPGASGQSQGKLTADGPVTLTGTQLGPEKSGGPVTMTATQTGSNALTALGGTFTCTNASYAGHKYNVTPHGLITSGATQVTVTPSYGSCTLFGKPATVDMNGCDYVFDLEGTTGTDEFGLKTTIVCPAEKDIQITLFDTEAKHGEGKSFCTLTITEKSEAYGGLTATDTTNGTIDVTGTIKEIVVDEKSASGLCAEAETKSAELHLDLNLTGKYSKGPIAMSISDSGQFEWNEVNEAPHNSTTNAIGRMACEGSTYTGHKYNVTPHEFVASGSTTFTVTPHYVNCVMKLLGVAPKPMTTTMNGCDYVFHIGSTVEGEGTYGVTTDIVCPAGKVIETHLYKAEASHTAENMTCSYKIKEQLGLGGLHVTSSSPDDIRVHGSLTGIHEEHTGSLCGTGTSTNSQLHWDVTVTGHNAEGAPTSIDITD